VYEEQGAEGATRETAMLAHLAGRGVETPSPVAARDGRFVGELVGKPAVLFPWRPGRMRCQASVTPADVTRIGAALAHVHVEGRGVSMGEGRFRPEDLTRRLARIRADARFAGVAPLLEGKLGRWLAERDPSLPRGLIHGDLFRDNVLWNDDGTISALLDFESASDGVLAYDLMVAVLAWCVGDGLDPELARALVAGYEAVRPMNPRERAGLRAEGCLAALRFTITRLTDYAMREEAAGPRTLKDWRRFLLRVEALEDLPSFP
jgi:homoserine kinase type II